MQEVFSKCMESEGLRFKYARGMRDIKGREFHLYHEFLLLKAGDAELISDKNRVHLLPNTLVIIPREQFHQFVVYGREENYCRCVVSVEHLPRFSPLLDAKIRDVHVLHAGKEIVALFDEMIQGMHLYSTEQERTFFLDAMVSLLLLRLDTPTESVSTETIQSFNRITYEALQYIDTHITEAIKILDIATHIHISVSRLNHVFKKDLNISVHSYILKKKLIFANHRISMGIPPTKIIEECGFSDYSGFYKQYVKMFGCTPSGKNEQKKKYQKKKNNFSQRDD